ncbi:MAG: hypothetical protein V1676_01105 [Candidatus Diapherotrites archaeon]
MGNENFLTPTLGKVALSALLTLTYFIPWVYEVPLLALVLVIYIPLRLAAEALGGGIFGLAECSAGNCFPDSFPLAAMAVVFIYTYIIVSAVIAILGGIGSVTSGAGGGSATQGGGKNEEK